MGGDPDVVEDLPELALQPVARREPLSLAPALPATAGTLVTWPRPGTGPRNLTLCRRRRSLKEPSSGGNAPPAGTGPDQILTDHSLCYPGG
jgi:hypothetical protein